MAQSKLKLNPSKTEFLLIGPKSQRDKFNNLLPLAVLDNKLNSADSAMNFGVFFDSGLIFCQHSSQVSIVTSKLDYCNSLLHEVSVEDLQTLQRVQNCLAMVVTKAPRFSRSIPLASDQA